MKRILAIICLLLTPVFFMGCGKASNGENSKNKQEADDRNGSVPKSEDLYSFEICLNRKLYTLPTDFSKLEEDGWSIEEGDSSKVVPQRSINITMKNGKAKAMASLTNNSMDELSAKECQVSSVQIDEYSAEKGVSMVLPKGITIGSTKDEVIKAYGNPTENRNRSLSYYIKVEKSIEIYIDEKTNKVSRIQVSNKIDNKEKSPSKDDNSNKEVPESIKNYKAPTELTDNIYSYNVKYDDVLYHMPVPVSELKKNGWEVQQSSSNIIASRDSALGVVLRKGNQTITTEVYNDSPKATSVENCVVTEMFADEYLKKIPLELPRGITIGSSKAEVDSAYADYRVKKDDRLTKSEVYDYANGYDKSIEININKETGKVSSIRVKYVPDIKK